MRKLTGIYVLLIASIQVFLFAGKDNQITMYRTNARVESGASRTSGVAPLSVHFTAGFSGTTPAARDFHNLDYTWDFGDPGSGRWGTSGKPRNIAKGPVATHIFEAPGIFIVKLTVKKGSATVNSKTFKIEVHDPDSVYSGVKTTCVSDKANHDFTGCPAGARNVATDDLNDIPRYVKAGTRILFRRGSSWTTEGISFPPNAGPVTIGAYGTGTGRDSSGIYNNAPLITVKGGSFCKLDNIQDWRITNLRLVNNERTGGPFGGAFNMQRILFQRLRIEGFSVGIGWSHWNNDRNLMTIDQMVLSDCDLKNADNNVVYAGGERIALLGNTIQNAMTSHVVRIWQGYLGVISNNIISGSSIKDDTGRHALKLHGPGYSSFDNAREYGPPAVSTGLLEHRTEYAVISDNVFGSSGPWPVMISPQDGFTDSLMNDIIFERNRIITNFGKKSPRDVSVALHIVARNVTVRNNIFNGTGSGSDYTAIEILSEGKQPAPLGVEVYNNTIYRADNNSGNGRYGIIVRKTARQTIVKNNLISFPNSRVPKFAISNSSSDLIEQKNLLTNTPGFIDPNNHKPLSANFNLQSGSPAINAGDTVPVFEDIDNNVRPIGNYDIGA
nr:PKD domain-containing protein [Spirochaetota bacterium]